MINFLPTHEVAKLLWFVFKPFSAGTVFRRQILTSKDGPRAVRFRRLKTVPALKELKNIMTETHARGIQMKRTEPTKTFMMISN